jgi:hypothetical protein
MGQAPRLDRPRQPTIRDVASQAGVGVGTVSRVLNGSASVSEGTHARVCQPLYETGARGADLLRTALAGGNDPVAELEELSVIERRTT